MTAMNLTHAAPRGPDSPAMGKLDLAKAILETGSFHWKTTPQFTLASGRVSQYYVDCKQLLSHPKYRRILAELIAEHLKGWEVQAVGGMEIGAIPIATAVSDYVYDRTGRELRTFVVRKKPKDHGMKHAVEGAFPGAELQAGLSTVCVASHWIATGRMSWQFSEPESLGSVHVRGGCTPQSS